jgi:hypothetical protein
VQTDINEMKLKDAEHIKLMQGHVDEPSDLLRDEVFID